MAGFNDPDFWLALRRLVSGNTAGEQIGNDSEDMGQYNTSRGAKEDADRLRREAAQKQQEMLDDERGLDPSMAGAIDAGVLNPQAAYGQYQTNLRQQQKQQKAAAQQNQTLAYLRKAAPDYAAAVESGVMTGPEAFKQHQADRSKKPNPMTAGKRLYNGEAGQGADMPAGSGEAMDHGAAPSPVQQDGKGFGSRPGENGAQKLEPLPNGANPMPGITNADPGTSIGDGNYAGSAPQENSSSQDDPAVDDLLRKYGAEMATPEHLSTALKNADKAGDIQGAKILANETMKMRGAQTASPPAATQLSSDRATETLSPTLVAQDRRDYINQQSLLARTNRGKQQPPKPYVEPHYDADDIIRRNIAGARQEVFAQRPWYEKLPVAVDDTSRTMLDGATFGYGDKAAAGLGSLLTGQSYEEALKGERAATQAAFDRAGDAGTAGQVTGALMTGGALAKGGLTLEGRLGTHLMPGVKGLLARTGLMATEGAAHGALDAAGHDHDMKSGAVAGAIGGVAGSVAADGLNSLVRKISAAGKGPPKVPDLTKLKQSAKKAYEDADNAGIVIKPEGMARLNDSIKTSLAHIGYDPLLQPEMAGVLDRLGKAGAENITLKGVDGIRRIAKDAKATQDPSERAIAAHVVNKIDDFVGALKKSDVLSSDPFKGHTALKTAKSLWSRVSKHERLTATIERAEKAAASSGPGANVENSIRQNLQGELEKGRGYTPDEKALLQQMVTGSPGQKALRLAGKLAPTGSVPSGLAPSAGALLGGMVAGPVGGALGASLPAMGTASKFLAEKNTRQAVDALQILVRGGGDAAALKKAQGTLASLSPSQRGMINRLVLTGAITLHGKDQEPGH